MEYAKYFTKVEDSVINAINLATKLTLFNKDGTWVKNGDNAFYDVTIGSLD